MKHPAVSFNGVIITLVSVSINKVYECEKDCFCADSCSSKKELMLNPKAKNLCVTEALVDILNPTPKPWNLRRSYWSLMDCDAYTYSASNICYQFDSKRIKDYDSVDLEPGTKSRIAIRFPEFEKGVGVSALIISARNESARLEIAPLNPDAATTLAEAQANASLEDPLSTPGRYGAYPGRSEYLLSKLERDCYARTHNSLIPREATKLENEINNANFEIEQLLRSYPQQAADVFRKKVSAIMETYRKELVQTQMVEKERVGVNQKVDDLYNLTDRAFEEWSADLFSSLGFDVELTPQSNDNGIDVICKKGGKLIVVQCKKYKGVVGRPEIQKFLGAIQNAGADEGYFLTTGTFSIGAEKAAQDTKIILCDKIKIAELIEIALQS